MDKEAEIFQATLDIRFSNNSGIGSNKAEEYIRQLTGHNCRPKTLLELQYECERVGISRQMLLRRLRWLLNIGELKVFEIKTIGGKDGAFRLSHPLIFYKIRKIEE